MPYIGGVGVYRRICDEVAAKGYEGFVTEAEVFTSPQRGEVGLRSNPGEGPQQSVRA